MQFSNRGSGFEPGPGPIRGFGVESPDQLRIRRDGSDQAWSGHRNGREQKIRSEGFKEQEEEDSRIMGRPANYQNGFGRGEGQGQPYDSHATQLNKNAGRDAPIQKAEITSMRSIQEGQRRRQRRPPGPQAVAPNYSGKNTIRMETYKAFKKMKRVEDRYAFGKTLG